MLTTRSRLELNIYSKLHIMLLSNASKPSLLCHSVYLLVIYHDSIVLLNSHAEFFMNALLEYYNMW